MKVGKKVWVIKGKKTREATLVSFGKGETATVRFAGREDETEVMKTALLAKPPKEGT